MNIYFRVDSSVDIGTGHLMRCLTLADHLREKGVNVSFISRLLPGNLSTFIQKKRYKVHNLSYTGQLHQVNNKYDKWLGVSWKTDAEETKTILKKDKNVKWLILDHYAIDSRWESELRPYVNKIMVIDDLASRSHDCDLLLDQNYHFNPDNRYVKLVPACCRLFLGPQYALLRPEFLEVREKLRKRDGSVKRVLISFGGCDLTNETSKALNAIRLLQRSDLSIDVVAGSLSPYQEEIRKTSASISNTNYYYQVNNMAELMANADLAIGAGGFTTWERCFLGLPALTIVISENQLESTEAVSSAGAIHNLGWHKNVNVQKLFAALKETMEDMVKLQNMSSSAIRIMGGSQYIFLGELINFIME